MDKKRNCATKHHRMINIDSVIKLTKRKIYLWHQSIDVVQSILIYASTLTFSVIHSSHWPRTSTIRQVRSWGRLSDTHAVAFKIDKEYFFVCKQFLRFLFFFLFNDDSLNPWGRYIVDITEQPGFYFQLMCTQNNAGHPKCAFRNVFAHKKMCLKPEKHAWWKS